MAELNKYLQDFIKQHAEAINAGEFLHVYGAFDTTSSYDCYQTAKFTNAMYDAGIDPLQYTNGVIPECFLFEDIFFPEDFVRLPDNVRGIYEQAFSGCTFDENFPIIIPATCLEIREFAFASSTIKKIELNCINKCNIWGRAFDDAVIDEMWLNEVPTNANFLEHVDIVKALYVPITTMEEFDALVSDPLYDAITKNKISNIISSITGEVFR